MINRLFEASEVGRTWSSEWMYIKNLPMLCIVPGRWGMRNSKVCKWRNDANLYLNTHRQIPTRSTCASIELICLTLGVQPEFRFFKWGAVFEFPRSQKICQVGQKTGWWVIATIHGRSTFLVLITVRTGELEQVGQGKLKPKNSIESQATYSKIVSEIGDLLKIGSLRRTVCDFPVCDFSL